MPLTIPTRFVEPFGVNAPSGNIRVVPVTSVDPNAASLDQGFPTNTLTPISAGGAPPDGRDFNGILNQITAWAQWQAAGGPIPYDATFAAAAGYPIGAKLSSAFLGDFWLNTVDGNTSDPNAGGSGWQAFSAIAVTTGDEKWRSTAEVLPGWVKQNFTTIGNASSNATQLADAATFNLYKWLWTNKSNTECPVYTSVGTPTTRGASAAADYAANKQIAVLDKRGTGQIGMDTMGGDPTTRLTGVPVVSGNATTAGSVLGENLHALVANENGSHLHGVNDGGHNHESTSGTVFGGLSTGTAKIGTDFTSVTTITDLGGILTTNAFTGVTLQTSGLGTGHNTVSRSAVGTWYLKL